MAEIKTKKTKASVKDFLGGIKDEQRRKDCQAVARMMRQATGAAPMMWGPSIVGFGDINYPGSGGKSTDWFQVGFSPRKTDLTLYLMTGFARHAELMKRLGKHKTGKSCLYIRRLEDVDTGVLQALINAATR